MIEIKYAVVKGAGGRPYTLPIAFGDEYEIAYNASNQQYISFDGYDINLDPTNTHNANVLYANLQLAIQKVKNDKNFEKILSVPLMCNFNAVNDKNFGILKRLQQLQFMTVDIPFANWDASTLFNSYEIQNQFMNLNSSFSFDYGCIENIVLPIGYKCAMGLNGSSITGYLNLEIPLFPKEAYSSIYNAFNFSFIHQDYWCTLSLYFSINDNTKPLEGYFRLQHRKIPSSSSSWSNFLKFTGDYTLLNSFIGYDNDPYNNVIGDSTTGGGNGTGIFTGDTIGASELPSISVLDTGFLSSFSPTQSQLQQLASYLWTSNFVTDVKKLFGDQPLNTIIGLGILPITPPLGDEESLILGGINTNVNMARVSQQYVRVDCGNVTLQPSYGAFLDYEPYTSVDLYLPYIGIVQLSTNDVMGKTIQIVYHVDIISGSCVAQVLCNGTIFYTFAGACLSQIPITNNDYGNLYRSVIEGVISFAGAISAAGGESGDAGVNLTHAASSLLNVHPVVNRSGAIHTANGFLNVQKPFLILSTPKMIASNMQNKYIGYPNYITTTLGLLSGYTEVENINLGVPGAMNEEVDEIKRLLQNGVFL